MDEARTSERVDVRLNFRLPTWRHRSDFRPFRFQRGRLRDVVLSKRILDLSVSVRARSAPRATPTAIAISPYVLAPSSRFAFSGFRRRERREFPSLWSFQLDMLYTRTCHYARFIRAAQRYYRRSEKCCSDIRFYSFSLDLFRACDEKLCRYNNFTR